jgi:hypothetical protein
MLLGMRHPKEGSHAYKAVVMHIPPDDRMNKSMTAINVVYSLPFKQPIL